MRPVEFGLAFLLEVVLVSGAWMLGATQRSPMLPDVVFHEVQSIEVRIAKRVQTLAVEVGCDADRLPVLQARADALQHQLSVAAERVERITAQVTEEYDDTRLTYAGQDDPSLYAPDVVERNVVELLRACEADIQILGMDCVDGRCRSVAQGPLYETVFGGFEEDSATEACRAARGTWFETYGGAADKAGATVTCEDGRTLTIELVGPSNPHAGSLSGPEPDCSQLAPRDCRALRGQWHADLFGFDELWARNEEIAREYGCGQ